VIRGAAGLAQHGPSKQQSPNDVQTESQKQPAGAWPPQALLRMQLWACVWWTPLVVTNTHVGTGDPQTVVVSPLHSVTAAWMLAHPDCWMQRVPSVEFGTLQNCTIEQLASTSSLVVLVLGSESVSAGSPACALAGSSVEPRVGSTAHADRPATSRTMTDTLYARNMVTPS
jgi:hypothetical protein